MTDNHQEHSLQTLGPAPGLQKITPETMEQLSNSGLNAAISDNEEMISENSSQYKMLFQHSKCSLTDVNKSVQSFPKLSTT